MSKAKNELSLSVDLAKLVKDGKISTNDAYLLQGKHDHEEKTAKLFAALMPQYDKIVPTIVKHVLAISELVNSLPDHPQPDGNGLGYLNEELEKRYNKYLKRAAGNVYRGFGGDIERMKTLLPVKGK